MRILPIGHDTCRNKRVNGVFNQKNGVRKSVVQARENVSFSGRRAPNAEELRALLQFKIPDLYSSITLLDPFQANKIFSRKVFSTSLKAIDNNISPIATSLFPVEYDMFNLIRTEAKITPQKSLEHFIEELVPLHRKILRKEQKPIFDNLYSLASDFPGDLLEKFNYLMYVSERKMNEDPIFIPFSMKEFKYKLNNIKKRIMTTSVRDEEKEAMSKLMSIAGSVQAIPKEKRLSESFKLGKYEDLQKSMISKFCEYLSRSVLASDGDLVELADISEKRIYKVPINIPFNRKSFIYDLQEITSKLEDKKLAHMVDKAAISLPTSKENLSAFIMKAAGRSEEQIGYDMISGSVGNIDHLVPSYRGGVDNLSNYALSSAYKNSQKAHSSFAEIYRHDKNIANYANAQICRLFFLADTTKIFEKVGLQKSYIYNLAKKLKKLSKDPSLKFDIGELKYM